MEDWTFKCRDWWILPCLATLVHSEHKLFKGDSPPCSDSGFCQNQLHSWISAQKVWQANPKACLELQRKEEGKCIILGIITNLMATYCKKLKGLFSIEPVGSSQDVFGVWIIDFSKKGLIPIVSILDILQTKHLHKDNIHTSVHNFSKHTWSAWLFYIKITFKLNTRSWSKKTSSPHLPSGAYPARHIWCIQQDVAHVIN